MKKLRLRTALALTALIIAGVVFSISTPVSAQTHSPPDVATGDDHSTAAGPAGGDAVDALAPPGESRPPQPRRRGPRSEGGVYKASIEPHWFAESTRFWYRNRLPGGRKAFVLVDAEQGTRGPAFDHEKVAKSVSQATGRECEADRLPFDEITYVDDGKAIRFAINGQSWKCGLKTYELTKVPGSAGVINGGLPELPARSAPRASRRTGPETELTFVNRTQGTVELFWLDPQGRRQSYGTLRAGGQRRQHTYAGHVWQVVDGEGRVIAVFQAEETPTKAEITGRPTTRGRGRRKPDRRRPPRDESPDGKWAAFVRDDNVFLRSRGDSKEIQLSQDGTPENSYGMLEWAPDSRTLVAFRIEPGDRKEVYLVESSPPGGGRAVLHTRPYALPGDKFTAYELNLFDVEDRKQTKPQLDRIDFSRPRLRWNGDGRRFAYEKVDRGHQRFRVIEVDSHTGQARNLIDETTETFIWTAHTENLRLSRVNWLEKTDEIIYASQRDGWRHLYLVDAAEGKISHQITKGEWVVRGIDLIDEDARQIWFHACGKNPDQDPYLIHYYRVNFDGSDLVALTEGNGTHSIQYSPDRKYLIDTYSRADMAPVHELRRTSDGRLVCELEKADISELIAGGWTPPEVFVAKGRDGKTDIWGIICRPRDLDPDKKYPVIEQIYAGPQSAYVPKRFSPFRRFSSLTDLGFIVVQMDGMGTAHRSKAFHDVCWKNLADAGLPDRILWHQAAAKKYPYYDISRVGVYGNSAGGQNAAGAVLFHGEFYKAAVASCGCHDNRMDKASWNEQWMGYPVGPQYAESSNIDNAHRLRGKLFLIVGEMDNNVPPESTMRLVDALIKAGKDFELLVIPGAGHGMGGAYGRRRMEDFFVRHLLGVEPPDRNAPRNTEVSQVRVE